MSERDEHNKKRDEMGIDAYAHAFSDDLHDGQEIIDHPDEYDKDTRDWNREKMFKILGIIMNAHLDPSVVLERAGTIWQAEHPKAGDSKDLL